MRLPHPQEIEVKAREIIERAYAYRISNPERLAAAYRVVERNTAARRMRIHAVR